MENDMTDKEYYASEIQILVLCGKHLPLYASSNDDTLLTGQIQVEISIDEKVVSTDHVIPSLEGDAVFRKKWSLYFNKRPEKPLVIKVKDRKLGVIGTKEILIEQIPFCPTWTRNLPIHHWKVQPKTDEIDKLHDNGKPIHIHNKLCEIQLILVVSRRYPVYPKIRWWKCCRSGRIIKPKILPSQRKTRWVLRDTQLQELGWERSAQPRDWSSMNVGHRINYRKERVSGLDRRSPNRQAFLRRQSQTQTTDMLQKYSIVNNILPPTTTTSEQTHINNFFTEHLLVNPQISSISIETALEAELEDESNKMSMINAANQRFLGKERSLTEITDIVAMTDTSRTTKSIWRSLPNLLIELDEKDDALKEILTEDPCFMQPIIESIHPKRIPTIGGIVVTIFGKNLGESREDILVLTLCGMDCLDNFEYLSRNKLKCRTRAFCQGKGTVMIVTKSGGRSICRETMEFYESADLTHLQGILTEEDLNIEQRFRRYEEKLEQDIARLVSSVASVEHYNKELQSYMTDLEDMMELADASLLTNYRQAEELMKKNKDFIAL